MASLDLGTLKAQIDADNKKFRVAIAGAQKELVDLRRTTERESAKINKQLETLNKNTGNVSKGFLNLGAAMSALTGAAVVSAARPAASAIDAMGAAAVIATQSIAPLSGVLLGLPGAMSGVLQGALGLKMGLSGLGDAFKAVNEGDNKALKEATKGLTQASQELVGVYKNEMFPALEKMRKQTANAVAPQFAKAMSNVTGIMPILSQGLADGADAFGDAALEASKFMKTPFFQGALTKIMSTNSRMLHMFGDAAVQLLKPLTQLMVAARPLQIVFGKWSKDIASYFTNMVKANTATGKFAQWIREAVSYTERWVSVLGNVGQALMGTLGAARPLANQFLNWLVDVTQRWEDWTESSSGKNAISEWLNRSVGPLKEFGLLLADTAKALFSLGNTAEGMAALTEIFYKLRTELLPALAALAGDVGPRAAANLVDLATGIARFLNMGSFNPILELAGAVGKLLSGFAALVAMVPGLGTLIGALLAFKSVLMTINFLAMAKAVLGFTSAGMGMARIVAPIQAAGAALTAFSMQSQGMIGPAQKGGVAAGALGARMTALGPTVGKAAGALGGMASFMAGPWGLAVAGGALALGAVNSALDDGVVAAKDYYAAFSAGRGSLEGNNDALMSIYETLHDMPSIMSRSLEFSDRWANTSASSFTNWGRTLQNPIDLLEEMGVRLEDVAAAASGSDAEWESFYNSVIAGAEANGHTAQTINVLKDNLNAVNSEIDTGKGKWADLAGQLDQTEQAQQRLNDSMMRAREILSKDNAIINYKQAMSDLSKELMEGKRTLNANTQEGRDNRRMLNQAASASLGYIDSLGLQSDEIDKLALAYGQQHKDFKQQMMDWGYGEKKAEALADKYIKIPKKVQTALNQPGIAEALRKTDSYKEAIQWLQKHGDVNSTVTTTFVNRGKSMMDPSAISTGGFIHNGDVKKFAPGGAVYGEGTGTSDSIPAWLSNGEFVINAASVRKYGLAVFSALNRGVLPKFAEGGIVGSSPSDQTTSKNFTSDSSKLAKAIAKETKKAADKIAGVIKTGSKEANVVFKASMDLYDKLLAQAKKDNQVGEKGAADNAMAKARKQANKEYARIMKQSNNQLLKAMKSSLKELTKAAKQTMQAAKQSLKQRVGAVKGNIMGFGSITQTGGTEFVSGAGLLEEMEARLGMAKQFRKQYNTLDKMGLNKKSLQEILDAGPQAGTEIMTALMEGSDKAAKSRIKQINEMEKKLARVGKGLGEEAARNEGYYSRLSEAKKDYRVLKNTEVKVENGAVQVKIDVKEAGNPKEVQNAVNKAVNQAFKDFVKELRASN